MIFLSDLDGVGSDWDDAFDRYAVTDWGHVPGIPLKHERHSFNFYDGQPEQVVTAIQAIMDAPGFYADLDPIDGWIDAMHSIDTLGHEVFIVTSPWLTNPTCVQDKQDWVARHLGESWRKRVILTNDKTLVHGDILVDDKPEIHGAHIPTWEHVLFDQPYNQGFPQRRLMSWEDWPRLLADVEFSRLLESRSNPTETGPLKHARRRSR